LTHIPGAVLYRAALSWRRPVRVCGFPDGLEEGVYTSARLAGYVGPGGEWLQMNARSSGGQWVRPGFSGAGVVDEQTGAVLGIVVSSYTDNTCGLAWMIPVETVVFHIPRVARWVTGDPAVGEGFGVPAGPAVDRPGLARDIAAWLGRRDTGDVIKVVVGSGVSEVRRVVTRSGLEPSAGSVDLALDVSGKTVDEVSERIISRAGIPRDEVVSPTEQVRSGIPPMTVALTDVDAAQNAAALVSQVVRPMVESGHRLILTFAAPSSPALALVRDWDVGSDGWRLARLGQRIEALRAAEQRLQSLSRRVMPSAPFTVCATDLRIALSALRDVAVSDPRLRERLERCERVTAERIRRTAEATDQMEALLIERDGLRGVFTAYQAKANDCGFAEDVALGAVYRRTHDSLWRLPVDVTAARDSVREYRAAVYRACAGWTGEGSP
jgi:serine protease Do